MAINLDLIGKPGKSFTYQYEWQECVLYALGIGAQPDELDFLYEGAKFKVFPTFAVVPAFPTMLDAVSKLKINPLMLLHGEQKIILHKAIPKKGVIKTEYTIPAIYDKGKGALVMAHAKSSLEDGTLLFENIASLFCRGEGGFGGDKGPKSEQPEVPENKEPDFQVSYPTLSNQAYLYRLSGDYNPLHADPKIAKLAGYSKPILHGLATYGFTGRAILHSVCSSDPSKLKSLSARFTSPVFPGETLIIKGWKIESGKYAVQTETDSGNIVLSNGFAEIDE